MHGGLHGGCMEMHGGLHGGCMHAIYTVDAQFLTHLSEFLHARQIRVLEP